MKKRLKKVIWCNSGWCPLKFGFCPSAAAWEREMSKMGLTEPYPSNSDARVTFFHRPGENVAIVCMDKIHHKKVSVVGLVAHEAVHVWQEALAVMQEQDKPGSEIEAYSIQAITQELLAAMEHAGVFKL